MRTPHFQCCNVCRSIRLLPWFLVSQRRRPNWNLKHTSFVHE